MHLSDSHRLLKAHSVRELGTRVAFNFEDLQRQGDQYLEQVRAQAADLLQAARSEAASIHQNALREAQEAGRREGLADAARQIEARVGQLVEHEISDRVERALPAVTTIATALRQEADEWRAHWETAAVKAAIAIAEKILHRTIAADPAAATGMIAEALRLAVGQPQIRVCLHPDDLARLGGEAENIVRSLSACAAAEVVPDAAVGHGGCRIETRHGEIDASLETIFDRVAEELLL